MAERHRPFSFRDLDPTGQHIWRRIANRYQWVEPKYDGHFVRVEIEGGACRVLSSTNRVIRTSCLGGGYEKHTELWCEWIRGTEWSKRESNRELYESLVVFASPILDGNKLQNPHGDDAREAIARWLGRHGKRLPYPAQLVQRVSAAKARDIWKRLVERDGYEGIIVGTGRELARMKRRATMDYVCMGFETSDSDRFAGWGVRSVIAGLYRGGRLTRITTVSGLTDSQRRDFYDSPKRYVGRVFEADGKQLFDSGRLRHPNFVRWRDDKPARECTI